MDRDNNRFDTNLKDKLKEEVKKDYINRQVGEYMSKLF